MGVCHMYHFCPAENDCADPDPVSKDLPWTINQEGLDSIWSGNETAKQEYPHPTGMLQLPLAHAQIMHALPPQPSSH